MFTPLLITSPEELPNSKIEPTFVLTSVPVILRVPVASSAPKVNVASMPTLIIAVLPVLVVKPSPRVIAISLPSSARIVTDLLT